MAAWDQYKAPNFGLLFYKQLYKEEEILFEKDNENEPNKSRIRSEDVTEENWDELIIYVDKKAKKSPFDIFYKTLYEKQADSYNQIENPEASQKIILTTTYPGLLIGSGYNHSTKARGDASIGFFFDHTTGQPIIPGSSVKGVCRHVFELDVDSRGNNATGTISVEFFKHLLEDIGEINQHLQKKANSLADALTIDMLNVLKENIFGDQKKAGKDIFFDAVINIEKTGNNTIFYSDFITPHKHPDRNKSHLDPFTNPNPIQFLKVGPGVVFEYRFKLAKDYSCSIELKEAIFKQILLTFGVGAKTNVGYGQFI